VPTKYNEISYKITFVINIIRDINIGFHNKMNELINSYKKYFTSTVELPSSLEPFILQGQGPVDSSPDLQKPLYFFVVDFSTPN
jgi:hypothetical protein